MQQIYTAKISRRKKYDLNGIHFKKLSNTQAKYLHERAKRLQSNRTPKNSSLNRTQISLNIEEEIIKFNERRESLDKKISSEISKLNSPLLTLNVQNRKPELPNWTYRNGFKKTIRISNVPLSKYHNRASHLNNTLIDSSYLLE